jgi:hypothetical protein
MIQQFRVRHFDSLSLWFNECCTGVHSSYGLGPPLFPPLPHFVSLINNRQKLGLLGCVISSSQGLYLHGITQQGDTKDKERCPKRNSNPGSSAQALQTHTSESAVTGSAHKAMWWRSISCLCQEIRKKLSLEQFSNIFE